MSIKPNQLTIIQALKGLKEKQFSAEELTRACLQRIEEVDKKVRAFITVCKNEALNQAEKADKLIQTDPQVLEAKPLLGIPIAFKDLYCTKGIKTTAGSNVLKNYMPVYDATVVGKLEEAGAIIIGKTNLDAWGHGGSGENSDFFVTHNPWDLEKTPGGSSSGSGVAVATDECLAATGTDTGGSIRCPASFCNVVGLKPTYGRVSRYGIIAMASSLDSIGHFSKTVQDSALILSITAGKDKRDATTPNQEVPNYLQVMKKPLKKIKIGLPCEYFTKGINKEVRDSIRKAADLFEKRGFSITEVSLPHTKYAVATYYIIQPSEVSSNLARYDGIRYGCGRVKFGDEAKRRIMLGTYSLSSGYYDAYYLKAMKVRTLITEDFEKAFKKVDLLLAPVSPTPPFNLGEKIDDPLALYLADIFTAPVNLAGLPALAIPCGFTQDNLPRTPESHGCKSVVRGLPIGMQLIGPQFSEALLFQVGDFYQQLTNHHKKKPTI